MSAGYPEGALFIFVTPADAGVCAKELFFWRESRIRRDDKHGGVR